jgi:NADPH-dependent 2,4-dienoyl-CoA reductase/sulfur reductase-like enzyme
MTKLVIIGSGASGFFAAKAALLTNKKVNVTIVDRKNYDLCSVCGLPFALKGTIEFDKLKHKLPDQKNLKRLLAHEALALNLEEKTILVKDLQTNETKNLDYDKLIIATGSTPILPELSFSKALVGKALHLVSSLESTKLLAEAISTSKSTILVGAGALGLEVALAIRKGLKNNILVLEKTSRVLPSNFDEDLSKIVERALIEKGLKFKFNSELRELRGENKIEFARIDNEVLHPDIVVFCIGSRPAVKLASEAGIKLGQTGGIKVNSRLETSAEDVYACGDCTETYSIITKKPILTKLASIAYRQGEIAGINAAGGNSTYHGAIGNFAIKLNGLELASVGLIAEEAEKVGYKIESIKINSRTKPEFMPGSEQIVMKLILDSETGRILGAQGIGKNVAWRINLIGLAIQKELTIQELKALELSYSPALSELHDILALLVEYGLRKIRK